MLSFLFSLLRSHWRAAIITGGVFSLSAFFAAEHLEIRHLSMKLAQCHSENVALETSNQQLTQSVQEQNAAIALMRQEGEKRSKEAALALNSARKIALKYTLSAKRIEGENIVRGDCADMMKLLNDMPTGR